MRLVRLCKRSDGMDPCLRRGFDFTGYKYPKFLRKQEFSP